MKVDGTAPWMSIFPVNRCFVFRFHDYFGECIMCIYIYTVYIMAKVCKVPKVPSHLTPTSPNIHTALLASPWRKSGRI